MVENTVPATDTQKSIILASQEVRTYIESFGNPLGVKSAARLQSNLLSRLGLELWQSTYPFDPYL